MKENSDKIKAAKFGTIDANHVKALGGQVSDLNSSETHNFVLRYHLTKYDLVANSCLGSNRYACEVGCCLDPNGPSYRKLC